MVLKFEPVYFYKVWGGNSFKRLYNYPTTENCGEAWGISAHPHGSSIVKAGPYKGKSLRELYKSERQLFGNYSQPEFPILVKLISASQDLSIQVHPDDQYAKKFNSLGKDESWYIINTEPNTKINIGHHANSVLELEDAIINDRLTTLLNYFPIKHGDMFYIKAGTIHAICGGTTLLEVQQSSDITFRLYDYNRLHNGKLRELHIKDALKCIEVPDNKKWEPHENQYFIVDSLTNINKTKLSSNQHGDYIFILEGEGLFDDISVSSGDFIMVTADSEYTVEGDLKYKKIVF